MILEINKSEDGKILSFNCWHIVDGELRHITQVLNDDKIEYYTDGIKENREITQ